MESAKPDLQAVFKKAGGATVEPDYGKRFAARRVSDNSDE